MNKLQTAVESYGMSESSRAILAQTPVVIMVSITGGGKNTIIDRLLETNKYHYVISHTTRPPRENDGVLEQNGVNYWFVSEEEMLVKLSDGDFIEAKWVHESYVYGTSVDELKHAQESGKIPLLEIDVQGVEEIMRAKPDTRAIFIVPPDYDTWMKRLTDRGDIVDDELQKRIHTAKKELRTALSSRFFQFLVNDDIDDAVTTAEKLIEGASSSDIGRQIAEELLKAIQSTIG